MNLKTCFFLLVPLCLVMACRSGPVETKTENGPFTTHVVDKEIPLFKDAGTNRLHITLTLLDTEQSGLKPLVRELLYEGMEPDQYAERLSASLESLYTKAADPPDSARPREESSDWDYREEFFPVSADPSVLVISRNREYYLGGAHGMRETQYFVIAPDTAIRVMLEDLVPAERKPALVSLIEDALREYTKIAADAPLEEGGFFENTVEQADNFYPGAEGLVFHWDPYEIAPYVMGSFEVTVPWEKIVPLLSARGASLLNK